VIRYSNLQLVYRMRSDPGNWTGCRAVPDLKEGQVRNGPTLAI